MKKAGMQLHAVPTCLPNKSPIVKKVQRLLSQP